jgi:hypothetical protein
MTSKCLIIAVAFSIALSGVVRLPASVEVNSDGKQVVSVDNTHQTLYFRSVRSTRGVDLCRGAKNEYREALCAFASPASHDQAAIATLAHIGLSSQLLSLRSLHIKLQV